VKLFCHAERPREDATRSGNLDQINDYDAPVDGAAMNGPSIFRCEEIIDWLARAWDSNARDTRGEGYHHVVKAALNTRRVK
jgi:hypothetical protein